MELEWLIGKTGEWLRGTGPESDVVVSSRIRLARNVADFPFPSRADAHNRAEISDLLRSQIEQLSIPEKLECVDVEALSVLDRQFLVERQLISRELSEASGARSVCIGPKENISLMINEEDHLRMQVLGSGYSVDECWEQIRRIDDELEREVSFAFSDEFGYLTSCPTNAGTGLRVSVMLHLPALVLTKEIQKVFQAMHKMSLAVRGLYGEGSQALGDFYQISNQVTLGKSEEQIVQKVKSVIPDILDYERRARRALTKSERQKLHDQVSRAFGILSNAWQITSEETMQHLSNVRMGVNLELVQDVEIPTINELFVQTQPAHLQKIHGKSMDKPERNEVRAAYLRQRLGRRDPSQN